MKNIAVAIITAVALASPMALAQSKASVDAQALEAASDLLEATNAREMMKHSMEAMAGQMPGAIRQSAVAAINADAKLSPAQKQQAIEKLEQMIPSLAESLRSTLLVPEMYDEILAEMPALYARHFTVAELRDLRDFYNTPAGRKSLQVMPQLMADSMQIGQRIASSRIQPLLARVQAQMAQAGGKPAK